MSVYIDASAAVKLVALEDESAALMSFLGALDEGERMFSSVLLETELRRAVTANGLSQETATSALAGIDLVGAPRAIFRDAGLLPAAGLRSLDALHLSTAVRHEASLLIAYDRRLLAASEMMGVATTSPH